MDILRKTLRTLPRILLPFLLGAGILYWMYRGTSWSEIFDVVSNHMDWGWMLISLSFGVFPQMLRGWRWRLALEPLGERPRSSTCVFAIFVSYAASLVIPRIGEITRCGTLSRIEGTGFAKSLGTVVSERIVDSLSMLLVFGAALLLQWQEFARFFKNTGTKFEALFSGTSMFVLLFVVVLLVVAVWYASKHVKLGGRLKTAIDNLVQGIASLAHMERLGLYVLYSVAIWVCYYLHFYLAFYSFDFTSHLGPLAGLAVFTAGSFAVLIPTPNGAGPWHFAVKTMLVLYGVEQGAGILFALVVHTLQTGLIVVLGIVGLTALSFIKRKTSNQHSPMSVASAGSSTARQL